MNPSFIKFEIDHKLIEYEIESYRSKHGKNPEYIVMSEDSLQMIENDYISKNYPIGDNCTLCSLKYYMGVMVLIDKTLNVGEFKVVG